MTNVFAMEVKNVLAVQSQPAAAVAIELLYRKNQ
tara:strand:+ start:492 stop:593 length:102 start_codon:yes stop_codon:yes gene_type:complete